MPTADTKNFDGKIFVHEKDDVFNDRDTADRHANSLKKRFKFITHTKVESQSNGTYWVWWSQIK